MENKTITAMRFAAGVLSAAEHKFRRLLKEPPQTEEEKTELALLIEERQALLNRCGANNLFELQDSLNTLIKTYKGMRRRGKKAFTITLTITEAYDDDP